MLAKERIEILNVACDENNQKIKEIENEIEILNNQITEWTEELDHYNYLTRTYEIERKSLTILMDIYNNVFPDCDLDIDIVPKKSKRINVYDENFKLAQVE